MNFMTNIPNAARKELKNLAETLSPFTKKVSMYTLWSLPLLSYSIFSLFFSLFLVSDNEISITALVIYAAIGAIGMALSKEAKWKRKEVQKVSMNYITDRINRSDIVSEGIKKDYIARIKEQPVSALNYFIKFLEEEDRLA
ncbi:hypothetical protein GCM10011409_25160 [Lentibacillus populi]|uniref:Uncharacterized protein n=1 Tax=Lentibacillus populi TaxID=1827502 RepID=A0A9W5X6D5_9BACI|nr:MULTISPECIES: DUF5392 family protein [Bacillaceae]GGB46582.1 hypothetical protein GCM10011409_25160 [Lentibacillus populi]